MGAVGSTSAGGGTGARWMAPPHAVQKLAVSGTGLPQLVQNMSLLGVVMHVHGLNADTSGPSHARQAHVRSAEESGAQSLELHVHIDGRIFIEKCAGFHHDAFTGFEPALEDVAVAVQQHQARAIGSDEAVHEHALSTEQNVSETLHAHERVIDLVRAKHKRVLANVDLHSRVQRQHYQFAGSIARERD